MANGSNLKGRLADSKEGALWPSLRAFMRLLYAGKHTLRKFYTCLIPHGSDLSNMESSAKRQRPRRIRHRIETECETEAEKDALSVRLQRMRELLSPDSSRLMDNGTLLHAMFDIVEREIAGVPRDIPETSASRSMMRNSGKTLFCVGYIKHKAVGQFAQYLHYIGMYHGDEDVSDSKLFICEQYAFSDLLKGLKTPCVCGMASNPWIVDSSVQVCIQNTRPTTSMHCHEILFLEGACCSCVVLLPSLPPTEKDLVQFPCLRWTLSRQPKV